MVDWLKCFLIFATNDWLNDKEMGYDENNICIIQSTTKQHWHLYKCWLYASHWLLGSRKGFKNHTRIRLCIDFTCSRWTTWICEIISWGQFTDVGRCRRFIRVIKCKQPVCFITHRLLNQIYYNWWKIGCILSKVQNFLKPSAFNSCYDTEDIPAILAIPDTLFFLPAFPFSDYCLKHRKAQFVEYQPEES